MENQTKTAESYIFKSFNLDEALKYPHRVWDSYREKFAKSVHLQEWAENYNVILKYNDDLTDNDFYTKEGKRFYTDKNPTIHLLDVEAMLKNGVKLPQHIYEIENILPSSVSNESVEQFTEFNLEIALQKPHLVRSKSYPNLVCRKVSVGDEDDVLVDWVGNHNQFTYTRHGASERLHMLVDETETNTHQQSNKTIPDHYKLPNNVETIFKQAEMLINGDRAKDYGDAKENFRNIAKMWSVYLGIDISNEQVAICMALLKICRLKNTPTHQDSILDTIGYLGLYDKLIKAK